MVRSNNILRQVDILKASTDPEAWNKIQILEELFKDEKVDEIVYQIFVVPMEETTINKTHHEYSGHSAMKPVKKLRRLMTHIRTFINFANNGKKTRDFMNNEYLYTLLAKAYANDCVNIRIIFSRVAFPADIIENAMLKTFANESLSNKRKTSARINLFSNEETNARLASCLITNQNSNQIAHSHYERKNTKTDTKLDAQNYTSMQDFFCKICNKSFSRDVKSHFSRNHAEILRRKNNRMRVRHWLTQEKYIIPENLDVVNAALAKKSVICQFCNTPIVPTNAVQHFKRC